MNKTSILNGMGLGALGTRCPEVHGASKREGIEGKLCGRFPQAGREFERTNYEGEGAGFIREAAEGGGIFMGSGAWIRDSRGVAHLSNVHATEPRRRSGEDPANGTRRDGSLRLRGRREFHPRTIGGNR